MGCVSVTPPTFEVIVTVTALVPAGVTCGGGVFDPLPPPPPPQPTTIVSNMTHAPRKQKPRSRFLCIGIKRMPTKPPKPKMANAKYVSGPRCIGFTRAAAVPAVVTVICTDALPFTGGVTLVGLKVQPAYSGTPEHANVTALLNPPSEVTVKLNVADWPARIVALEADGLALKSSMETE